jgi:hypothetical protein
MAHATWLPAWYLDGFRAPAMPGEPGHATWVYRAATGAWSRAPVQRGAVDRPHFNDAAPLDPLAPLGEALEALGPLVRPLLEGGLPADRPLSREARWGVARLAALLGVRNARRGGTLPLDEAHRGAEALAGTVAEMGFVFWRAPPGVFFVTSSSPFHAAFPALAANQVTGFDLTEPSVEITLPLLPTVALHATWRRRGEHWRVAGERAALELNGRTCVSSSDYLAAPEPQVPG